MLYIFIKKDVCAEERGTQHTHTRSNAATKARCGAQTPCEPCGEPWWSSSYACDAGWRRGGCTTELGRAGVAGTSRPARAAAAGNYACTPPRLQALPAGRPPRGQAKRYQHRRRRHPLTASGCGAGTKYTVRGSGVGTRRGQRGFPEIACSKGSRCRTPRAEQPRRSTLAGVTAHSS